MMGGLTDWFDPNGRKEEAFGIRFPPGKSDTAGFGEKERIFVAYREKSKKNTPPLDKIPETTQACLDILISGDTGTQLVSEIKTQGVNVRLGRIEGRLIYELKVPLYQTEKFPYAIGMLNSGTLGIKFVTEKMDKEEMKKKSGRVRMGGMSGPGSVGRSGGMGRGGGMKGPDGMGGLGKKDRRPGGNMQPLELWMEVQLAQIAN